MFLRLIIVLVLTLIGFIANAGSIEQQIQRAAPFMAISDVKALAQNIRISCHKHKVPCDVLTSILATESMFQVGAYNAKTLDYGIAQINIKTIKVYKLDKRRLLTDVAYSVDSGALVLSWFYRTYGRREASWSCRYNIGTGTLNGTRLANCIKYAARLSQYNIAAE